MTEVELRAELEQQTARAQYAEARLADCERRLYEAHRTIRALELAAATRGELSGLDEDYGPWLGKVIG